jgi:predicted O-methyltransferase YrrM
MKLHQSTVMLNLDKFPGAHVNGKMRLPRDNNDMLQLWRVCEYFQFKSFLEIGFSAGQTFGLFLDATIGNDTKYVAVDNDFERNQTIVNIIFGNHPKKKNIQFINADSRDLELTEKFDFIHIDANHSYEFVLNDLQKCLPLMHDKTILSMDDTLDHGVSKVIEENLLGQNNFIPFLAGNKQILFRHKSNDLTNFLNKHLRIGFDDFVTFDSWNYHGFSVVKMHVPMFIEENQEIFNLALQTYNI